MDQKQIKERIGSQSKAEILLGELEDAVMEQLDLCVISPGVPTDLPVVNRIREKNIPIWSEIELAYQTGKGDVLGNYGNEWKNNNDSASW